MNFFSIVLSFFVFNLIIANRVHCIKLFINADTGELTEIEPQNKALWPTLESNHPYCSDNLDAQFINHDGRYQIDEWIYIEQNFQSHGSIISVVNIYDLREMVTYAYSDGIWHESDNCDSIWDLMKSQLIEKAIKAIKIQSRPTVASRFHGLLVDIRCKLNNHSEDVPCTSQMLRKITHATTSKPFRTYSRK